MSTEAITIRVDQEAASAYRAASDEQRQKLDLLLSLRLTELRSSEALLEQVMRDISRKALERGLTPETLQAIFDER